MKVLIRNETTRKYLGPNGTWVAEAEEGIRFSSLRAAGERARQYEDCDIVLMYDNPPCELALNPAFCI